MDTGAAYLDLLKKSLCDLLGYHVLSADLQPDGSVAPTLHGDEMRERRETGGDWPLNGTTMVGMRRLDHLQRCVEAVVRDEVEGDLIETGVWRGGASILTRGTLRVLGAEEREVWVADSFEGLPESRPEQFPADAGDRHHSYDFLAVSEAEVRGAFERYDLLDHRVRFLKGWFSDTLPPHGGSLFRVHLFEPSERRSRMLRKPLALLTALTTTKRPVVSGCAAANMKPDDSASPRVAGELKLVIWSDGSVPKSTRLPAAARMEWPMTTAAQVAKLLKMLLSSGPFESAIIRRSYAANCAAVMVAHCSGSTRVATKPADAAYAISSEPSIPYSYDV